MEKKILITALFIIGILILLPMNAVAAEYTTEINEAAVVLKEGIKNREESIIVNYQIPVSEYDGSYEQFQEMANSIVNEVSRHTGKPDEGDFIRYELSGYDITYEGTAYDNFHYLNIKFTPKYYTTAEQYKELENEISSLINKFAFTSDTTDYEKIKTVYDYLCKNVKYDYTNKNDETYLLKHSAYAALVQKTSVCQGYATSFYRLMLECGVDCRIISGFGNGEDHAWNIVKLDGKYYNLDATWDAELPSYMYFLKQENSFPNHTRDAEYLTDEFMNVYQMAKNNYTPPTGTWIDYAADSFSGGDGTEESPYIIKSAEELALMAKLVNEEIMQYSQSHDPSCLHYAVANYVLESDIDIAGHDWMPIGAFKTQGWSVDCYGFWGNFDGQLYTISNMSITNALSQTDKYGLFGMILGTVENVTLREPVISLVSDDEGWQADNGMGSQIYIGGVCGYLTKNNNTGEFTTGDGILRNCKVIDAKINAKAAMSLTCGGAVGTLNYGNMENVIVSGEISGASGRAIWVGGCIGDVGNECSVKYSGFTGKVTAESDGNLDIEGTDANGYVHYVGGFCGSAGRASRNVSITDCYAFADIFSKTEQGMQDVGGFAGAIGFIYESAVYEDLIFEGTITTDRAGVVTTENDFWQGEFGNGPSGELEEYHPDHWYKNCVVITGDDVKVFEKQKALLTDGTNFSEWLVYVFSNYSLTEYSMEEVFLDTLGFDERIWFVDDNNNFILRNAYTGKVAETGCHVPRIYGRVEPTCYTTGYTGNSLCKLCHNVLAYGEVIPEVEHNPVLKGVVEATCTMRSYTGDTVCEHCGWIMGWGTYGPALGHKYGSKINTVESTCTEPGRHEKICENCGEIEFTEIPAKGHTEAVVNAVEATVTTDGYTGDTVCSVCGEVLKKGEVIPALLYKPGDINGDNKINALDATQILRFANNKPSAVSSLDESERFGRGDVNNDGKINALDATQILRYANNKPSALTK